MGCMIRLRKRAGRLSLLDIITIAIENIMHHYQRVFQPTRLEMWQNAPSTAMGGILSSELPVIDIRSAEAQLAEYFRKVPRDPASRPIIRIRGTWKILSREQQGYLSVNLEPSWAQVYGDISMSLYPTRDVQDLIELFWLTIDTRASLVDSFINAVEGWNEEGKKYDRVYFARGVPSPSSMDSYAAAYYSEPIQLYDDLVSAIKASYGFKEVANITPYRRSSLLHGLSELEIAKYRLGKIMDYHKISVNYGHSVSFVAEKVDGFAKVVRWLSDGIVLPAIRKLEDRQSLIRSMETGIKEVPLDFGK